MFSANFATLLNNKLFQDSNIFTDPDSSEFKEILQRWSDIDLKVPAAIVQPVKEQDAVTAVSP